ncbi:hypothetical protein PHLGIDRAFT_130272 [Phlebiopsis gigantea 11061_1 CR5-6]|uniref:Ricin B lectin domain-containing protein n=1 Tax=Phlebiopsis gigantea (strain 11061_1 CR5-6) TaxID=745531 RepID=A0A0C3PDB4_PHLG1|nr:hypothetical protein PHLGIDRAFT_130272 [Phlebiopsis gigantea 11061_1 CR5-6]
MSMPVVAPGFYRIRNLGTNQYLALEGGYASPGQKTALKSYSQEASHRWMVEYLGQGAYRVRPSANHQIQLEPGIPATRRTNPVLEVNVESGFLWHFGETPTGQGVFMVQYNEQDQVAEADPVASNVMLNDLTTVPARDNVNQMWIFEVAP